MNATTASRRPYRQQARAAAAAATGDQIVEAATELFWERLGPDFSLDDVASRAGVSVRTVIRRFGGKSGLLTACVERDRQRVEDQRAEAPTGDVAGAVRVLVAHYEQLGERVLLLLAAEARNPDLTAILDAGRGSHVAWCERVFAPTLERLRGSKRERRLAQFVGVCDVYMWKLLRLDRGLSKEQTELALAELLEPLT